MDFITLAFAGVVAVGLPVASKIGVQGGTNGYDSYGNRDHGDGFPESGWSLGSFYDQP